MNPKQTLQFKLAWDSFNRNHPKFMPFLNAAQAHKLKEGTIIEINISPPDSSPITANIKLSKSDLELLKLLSSVRK